MRVFPSRGPIDLRNQDLGAQKAQTILATRRIQKAKYTEYRKPRAASSAQAARFRPDPRGRRLFRPRSISQPMAFVPGAGSKSNCDNQVYNVPIVCCRHSAEQRCPINPINISRFGLVTAEFRMSYSRCIVAGNSANNARSRRWSDGARGWIASKLDASCGRQSRGAEAKCDNFGCQRSLCGERIGNWGDCVSGMKLLARGARARSTGG